jgi:histidinol phosphatase-like enzyme
VRSCFYEDINDDFVFCSDSNSQAASVGLVKKAVSDFVSYIKEYLVSLPSATRKYTMQSIISALPIDLNFDEIMAYIKEGIDNASSFEQQLLIVDKIGNVFLDNGMTFDDVEDECHHTHDDECSCGHNHNH